MPRALLALCLILAGGCAHQITLDPATAPPSRLAGRAPAPLLVENVRVTNNGRASGVDDGFVNRVVMELRRTRSFAEVLPPAAAAGATKDAVRLRMEVSETTDEHWGPNIGKAIAVGMSLLVLAPVVRFESGYHVELRSELVTCDAWTRELRSESGGTMRYAALFSTELKGRQELVQRVVESALQSAVDQIAADAALRSRVEALVREGDCEPSVVAP